MASALRKLALAAALCTAFSAAPAAATITLVSASDIQGANVLFNDGPLTGTTVVGQTTIDTLVNFTGTTTNSNIIVGTGGQARLEGAPNGNSNDTFGLTSVDFSLASGTFNNLEFNLNSASAGAVVTFTAIDNNGDPFIFNNDGAGFTLGSGENFFGFLGIDNQSIASFSIDVTSGSLQDVRQIRLDGTSAVGAVPEPGTWAMMLIGFGAIGVGMRRRRRTGRTLMQAV